MAKFCVARNKDAADAYTRALVGAGHEKVKSYSSADFVLFDCERKGSQRDRLEIFLRDHPGFIYPHTPLTYWLWDGPYDELPVKCNFVAAEGAKTAMQSYGYKSRVEVCGFSRCEVLDFKSTTGTKLLFVPARPRKDSGRQFEFDSNAYSFIAKNHQRFEKVTICFVNEQSNIFKFVSRFSRYSNFEFILTDPKSSTNPTNEMIARIDKADIVISTTTVAALAVARGKPTIFYGEGIVAPETTMGSVAKNYDLYRDIYEFPLSLERMNIEEILSVRSAQNPSVERWKQLNIGSNFDSHKFLRIVSEYI